MDAGLELSRRLLPPLTADLRSSASYGSQEDETYREKYLAETGLRWDFSGSSYSRLRAYWTRDELSGISHEYGASAGLGRSLLSTEAFLASMEAGAGLLHRESTADSLLDTYTGYLSVDLEWTPTDIWTLTEEARLTNDFRDSENYTIESVLEAGSSITGNLSLLVGYDITYHHLPPVEGNEKTDTALRLQLRLGF
jgi:putative salt-induced outer membrane protein YdiY